MSQPVDAKYQSKELNLYSTDGKNKYSFTDATGLIPGLAPSTPILKLESDVSAEGMQGSIAIPNLLYKLHASQYYSFLSYALFALESKDTELTSGLAQEVVDRKASDSVLTVGLAGEVKARQDADAIHTSAIATEVYDRTAGDLANLTKINQEIADRKAGIFAVSSNGAQTYIELQAEVNRALQAESDEAKARADSDASIQQYIGQVVFQSEQALATEVSARTAQFGALDGGLTAEVKRATDKEALLDARIDFITHNSNPSAIDSLSEIVSQFSTNGQGYADRLSYLEGVIAGLVNKSQ